MQHRPARGGEALLQHPPPPAADGFLATWRHAAQAASGVRPANGALWSLAVVLLAAGLTVLSLHSERYAVEGAGLALVAAVIIVNRALLPVVAIPATLVIDRVGASSTNLSVSDALLFFGALAALFDVRLKEDVELRRLLGLVAVYEGAALVTVLYNPYRADVTEWVHEAFLAGGSLLVGWAVARTGHARHALVPFLVGACILSLAAVGEGVAHHLTPAQVPFGYQKNALGDLLAFGVLVAFANPPFCRLTKTQRRWVIALCLAGVGASQSRQALIGLLVAVPFVAQGFSLRRRRVQLALAPFGIATLVYIGIEVHKQVASSNQFNSLHQRLAWYHDSLAVLHASPWFGVGLRWWYESRFPFSFQPPNAELEVVTSVGLLGLAAFAVLFAGALIRLYRAAPRIGRLAFAALLMRVVQGQFDVFWVTAQAAIPWMIVGLALGADVRARALRASTGRRARAHRPLAAARARQGP